MTEQALTVDEVKRALGDQRYAQLMAWHARKVEAAYARGKSEGSWKPALAGAVRSRTVWLGVALAWLPELWPQLQPLVIEALGPDASRRVVQLAGIAVVGMRFLTTQSLPDKVKEKADA